MKEYAIVQAGIVINTVVWDGVSPWTPPAGTIAVDVTNLIPQPSIEWTYDGTNFFPPTQ